jgi:hypothetical protein
MKSRSRAAITTRMPGAAMPLATATGTTPMSAVAIPSSTFAPTRIQNPAGCVRVGGVGRTDVGASGAISGADSARAILGEPP